MATAVANLLAVLLLLHLAGKLVGLVNGIRWVERHGVSYQQMFARHQAKTLQQQVAVLASIPGGMVFPFGIKDYRVRRLYAPRTTDSRLRAASRLALRAWHRLLFATPPLVVAGITLICALEFAENRSTNRVLLAALASATVLACITVFAEAFTAHQKVGSYAAAFYAFGLNRELGRIAEMRMFIYLALSSLLATASLALVGASRFDAYAMAVDGDQVQRGADAVFAALLNTASAMSVLGDSPWRPVNWFGYLVQTAAVAQGVLFILFGIAWLSSTFSNAAHPSGRV